MMCVEVRFVLLGFRFFLNVFFLFFKFLLFLYFDFFVCDFKMDINVSFVCVFLFGGEMKLWDYFSDWFIVCLNLFIVLFKIIVDVFIFC